MDINYLKEFLVLAEGKSYLEAADILYISQSSLSKHIKKLEEDMGVLLFKRTTRKVILSEYGELFLPYAKNIVQNQEAFYTALEKFGQQMGNSLTVGATSLMAVYGITEVLTKFSTENQGVKFNLIEGDATELKELMLSERCDFAFIRQVNWNPDEEFDGIKFDVDNLAAIFNIDHPLAKQKKVSIQQLKNENFLLMQGHELIFDLCKQVFSDANFDAKVVFTGSNSSTIVEMVGQGVGISLLMKKPAIRTCQGNSKVRIVDVDPLIQSDIVLIYRKKMQMLPVHQLFLETLKECMNKADRREG